MNTGNMKWEGSFAGKVETVHSLVKNRELLGAPSTGGELKKCSPT